MNTSRNSFTVINTRPAHQATELSRKLWEINVSPIEFPTIEIRDPDSWEEVDDAIHNLDRYDWLVFTSQNGVERFLRRARSLDVESSESINHRIAAIGPTTAERLEDYGLTVEVCPDEYRSEQLAVSLLSHVEDNDKLLLPRSNISRPVLVDTLNDHGLHVREIHPYILTAPDQHASDTLERIRTETVDLIAFTSSMTARNFHELTEEYELTHLHDCPTACIGPITAGTARDLGYKTPVVAEEYTTDGLVEAIRVYWEEVGGEVRNSS